MQVSFEEDLHDYIRTAERTGNAEYPYLQRCQLKLFGMSWLFRYRLPRSSGRLVT